MKKIKKNNIATKSDIQKLDKKLGFLEKKLNGEIREVKNELSATRFKLGTEIDKSKIEILDQIKEFRSEILEKVAEFASGSKEVEEEVKIIHHRVYEEHEPRIEKLEKKVFLKKN